MANITIAAEPQTITAKDLNNRYSWQKSRDGTGLEGNLCTGEDQTEHLHADTIRSAFNGAGPNLNVRFNGGSTVSIEGLGAEAVTQLTSGDNAQILLSTPGSYFATRAKVHKQNRDSGISK